LDSSELLPGLSDVLSIAAGHPVDAAAVTPEEAAAILDGYQARKEEEDENAKSGVTAGSVRVTATEETEEPDPCEIGPYSEMSRKCASRGGQAHHIIPDYALRAGPRPRTIADDTERPANVPSLRDGMAICLTGHARVAAEGNEHYAAHFTTDAAIMADGAGNTVLPGTTIWEEVRSASLDGISQAKPECYEAAVSAINAQFSSVPLDQIMRGAIDYRTLSPAALSAIKSGSQMIDGTVVP
ncbi:hypothetical protein LZ189_15175, partial [Rhodovulum sulfidophilum]|nr:hypothetical protein [Rhodovulum sulfidophilum]